MAPREKPSSRRFAQLGPREYPQKTIPRKSHRAETVWVRSENPPRKIVQKKNPKKTLGPKMKSKKKHFLRKNTLEKPFLDRKNPPGGKCGLEKPSGPFPRKIVQKKKPEKNPQSKNVNLENPHHTAQKPSTKKRAIGKPSGGEKKTIALSATPAPLSAKPSLE